MEWLPESFWIAATSSSKNTVTRRFGLSGLSGVPVIVRSAWSKRSSDSVAAVTCSGEPSE